MPRRVGLLIGVVLLAALSVAGCGTAGSGATGIELPDEATVVFHDPPHAARTPGAPSFPATTIIFTTATKDLEKEPDQGLEVTVGTRPPGSLAPRSATQAAKASARPVTRVLDRDSFARLWKNLDQAGLFKLPRYPGAQPPTNENYILVKTPANRWIYTRPRSTGQAREDLEKTSQLVHYWSASRMAIVSFLNS